jgi:hypothetical protein
MTKRKIFAELMEGIVAIRAHRVGKSALRSYKNQTDTFAPSQCADHPEAAERVIFSRCLDASCTSRCASNSLPLYKIVAFS